MESEPKTSAFRTVHIQKLQFRPLKNVPTNLDGRDLWNNDKSEHTLTYEETCKPTIIADYYNGFFSAFLNAYNRHGDVKITPDDVWITIMLYFSKYVNNNAEQLRHAFVSHEGKKKLTVITENQLSEGQWDEFFTLMIQAIKKNTTEGVTANFECDFSTTNRVERILSTSAIMNVFKKYFDYERCIPECGIQNVHFGGTLEDWQKLKVKTEKLGIYDVNGDLKTYIQKLSPILNNFIETYNGEVDVKYWNKVLSIKGPYSSGFNYTFDGWLLNFFGIYDEATDVDLQTVCFDIVIDNRLTGIIKTVKLVGGFRAVSLEGQVFRPHMSMAILQSCENSVPQEENIPESISLCRYDVEWKEEESKRQSH